MKIFAFAGSSSSESINKQLVQFALKNLDSFKNTLIDLNDFEMPLYSIDREKQNFPEAAHRFYDAITASDAIVCSLAEHNKSYTVAFKNIFDWASRIDAKVFQRKPMMLMSTSPGAYGGGNVLAEAQKFFPQFGAEIIAHFSLPKFQENFDSEQGITDAALREELLQKISAFKNHLINKKHS